MTARIRPVVSHLGGERNHLADGLSRAKTDVLSQFDIPRRIEYPLAHIIFVEPSGSPFFQKEPSL